MARLRQRQQPIHAPRRVRRLPYPKKVASCAPVGWRSLQACSRKSNIRPPSSCLIPLDRHYLPMTTWPCSTSVPPRPRNSACLSRTNNASCMLRRPRGRPPKSQPCPPFYPQHLAKPSCPHITPLHLPFPLH